MLGLCWAQAASLRGRLGRHGAGRGPMDGGGSGFSGLSVQGLPREPLIKEYTLNHNIKAPII